MRKKAVAILLSLAMAASLVACSASSGGNKASTESKEEEGQTKGGTTIEVWSSSPTSEEQGEVIKKQIAKYEEESGNEVNYTEFSYDMLHDKVLSSAAGKNTPDLVWGLPEWVGEFYNMGILEDLTERYESWEDASSLSDAVKKAMTIDGKLVGVPYEMTVRAYLCHENMLKKAGVKAPTTWDDVLAMTDFKEKAGVYPYGIAAVGARAPQELLVYLAQYELEICSAQDDGKYKNTWKDNSEELEKAEKVFQFYKDCIDKGVTDPNSRAWGYEETDENFSTGLCATYVCGNWLQEKETTNPDEMEDVLIEPIPAPIDGQEATYMECKPLFIFNTSKNKEEAFDLAAAVCGKEWQEDVYASRSPRSDVQTDSKWSKDFSALADTGVTFPPVTLGGISQAMIDSIAMVLQEGKTPKEAAEWLSDAVNKSLDDSGEFSAS